MMNKVIEQLSAIEETACKIADNTVEQKKQLSQAAEQRKADYSQEWQKKLDEEIALMHKNNDVKLQETVENIRIKSAKEIQQMEEIYTKEHTKIAQDIVNALTGV